MNDDIREQSQSFLLDSLGNPSSPVTPDQTVVEPKFAPIGSTYSQIELPYGRESEDDLLTKRDIMANPAAMVTVDKYLFTVAGLDVSNMELEDRVNSYYDRMRWFGTNTAAMARELASLQMHRDDEDFKSTAWEAYQLWDQTAGIFNEESSWGDTFEGIQEYGRALLLDPTNLLGAGIGKATTMIAGRSAIAAVKIGTRTAAEVGKANARAGLVLAVEKATAQGMAKTLAKEAGGKAAASRIQAKIASGVALTATEQASLGRAKSLLAAKGMNSYAKSKAGQAAFRREAITEIGVATGVDMTSSFLMEKGYQSGLHIASNGEYEKNPWALGLAALSGGVGGGIAYGLNRITGKSMYQMSPYMSKVAGLKEDITRQATKAASSVADESIAATKKMWADKVKDGFTTSKVSFLDVANDIFWGNTEAPGIISRMALDDDLKKYVTLRSSADNLTDFATDIVAGLPENQQSAIVDMFKSRLMEAFPDGKVEWENLAGNAVENVFIKDLTMQDLVGYVAQSASKAGRDLAVLSKGERYIRGILGQSWKDLAEKDAIKLFKPVPDEVVAEELTKTRPLRYIQNLAIQGMVTHPATTIRNISGAGQKMAYEFSTDMLKSLLYGGYGVLTADKKLINYAFKKGAANLKLFKNIVNPGATYKETIEILDHIGKTDDLFRFYAGGVERADALKDMGVNPNNPLVKVGEGAKDFFQMLYGTELQDRFFKSQSFMWRLNKNIIDWQYRDTGAPRDLEEFFSQMTKADLSKYLDNKTGIQKGQFGPDILTGKPTDDFVGMVVKSIDGALGDTFSRSYTTPGQSISKAFGENPLHGTAQFIEGIRNAPGLGVMLPFGQFFNNTVDFLSDVTGMKAVYRLATKANAGIFNNPQYYSWEDVGDSILHGAVGWGFITTLVPYEEEAIGLGLSWKEWQTEQGDIVDTEGYFPWPAGKFLARAIAMYNKEGYIPDSLIDEGFLTFGPESFTRNLDSGMKDINDVFKNIFQGEGGKDRFREAITEVATLAADSYGSGLTRMLDPINQLSAMISGDYENFDRDSGWKLLTHAFRYIDKTEPFKSLLESTGAVRAVDATGPQWKSPLRTLGVDVIPPNTALRKMYNEIGDEYWPLNQFQGPPEFQNTMNSIIFETLEPLAERMLKSDRWTGDAKQKAKILAQMKTNAGATLKRKIADQYYVTNSVQFGKIYDLITNNSMNDIDYIMKRDPANFGGREFWQLEPQTLDILDWQLKKLKRGEYTPPVSTP